MNKAYKLIRSFTFRLLAVFVLLMLMACTDKKDAPILLELRALPNSITISDKFFYPKPFSIRAKYSDNTEINVTSRMTWISENRSLINVNKQGEIEKTGDCEKTKCLVSLITTDPESGKSLRLTVHIIQKKSVAPLKKQREEKTLPTTSTIDEPEALAVFDDVSFEEEKNEPDMAHLGFSLLNTSESMTDETPLSVSHSAAKTQFIRQLFFEENDILLVSGEAYFSQVVVMGNRGQRQLNHENIYECYSLDDLNPSVMVLPPCQLIAVEPGEANVGINFLGDQSESVDTQTLNIKVVARSLNASISGFSLSLSMSKNKVQQWFRVSGLRAFNDYRVLLKGNLAMGTRLSVFTPSFLKYPACLNTVPLGFASVACYFQAKNDEVMLVVSNPAGQSVLIDFILELVTDKSLSSVEKFSVNTPVAVELGMPVSDYIFANEAGGNNQHHYVFKADNLLSKNLQITLSEFSAPIELSVNWAGGFCREKGGSQLGAETMCRVSNYLGGDILISIDGNNGEFGLFNGPAAALGGAFYRLALFSEE